LHMGLSVAFGAAMTLPFSIACEIPAAPCLLRFLPYDGACGLAQRRTYVSVYSAHALILAACLGVCLHVSRTRSARGRATSMLPAATTLEALPTAALPPSSLPPSPSPSPSAPSPAPSPSPSPSPPPSPPAALEPVAGDTSPAAEAAADMGAPEQALLCAKRTGMKLRVRVTMALFTLRSVFSLVFITEYSSHFGDGDCASVLAASAGGSSALLLLILVMLVDGQGGVTCVLFGFQPEVLAKVGSVGARIKRMVFDSSGLCRQCCANHGFSVFNEFSLRRSGLTEENDGGPLLLDGPSPSMDL
jgi:hypothetical protein